MTPFSYIADHAYLHLAARMDEADKLLRQKITPRTLEKIVDMIPQEWLTWEGSEMNAEELRRQYKLFLTTRLKNSQIFVKEAIDARAKRI